MSQKGLTLKDFGNNIKTIDYSVFGGFDAFLLATSTGGGGVVKPDLLRRVVPWVAKACNMTKTAVSMLPFEIMDDNDEVYDKSSEWKNKLGGIPSPSHILSQIAESLCMGKAYVIPTVVSGSLLNLQYCAPHTVVPLITTQGLAYFPRTSDWGQAGIYAPAGMGVEIGDPFDSATAIPIDTAAGYTANGAPVKVNGGSFKGEMLYFWLPDSAIEIGPAKNYPMATSLQAVQLLASMDATLNIYAERGFVPPTVLSIAGGATTEEQAKTAETKWNAWMRGWTQKVAKIIQGEKVEVVKVGAGFEALNGIYKDLSNKQIESIGAAFGIPAAIFMADMAFASEVTPMVREWYSNGIFVTIYKTIESTFNSQLLNRFGKRMAFRPESLRAFREDQVKLASAFRMFVSGGMRPSIAAQALEIDMPEGTDFNALDETYDKGLLQNDKPVAPLSNATQPVQDRPETPAPFGGKALQLDADTIKELALWKDISMRCMRKGKGAAVDFECKAMSEDTAGPIRLKLAEAKNELDVIKAFDLNTQIPTAENDLIKAMYLEVSGILAAQKAQKAG